MEDKDSWKENIDSVLEGTGGLTMIHSGKKLMKTPPYKDLKDILKRTKKMQQKIVDNNLIKNYNLSGARRAESLRKLMKVRKAFGGAMILTGVGSIANGMFKLMKEKKTEQ